MYILCIEKASLMLDVSVPSRLGSSNVESKSKTQKTTESLCLAERFLPWASHSSVCAQLFGDLAVRSNGNNSLGMNKINKIWGKNRFKKRAKRIRERQSGMGQFFVPCAALEAGSKCDSNGVFKDGSCLMGPTKFLLLLMLCAVCTERKMAWGSGFVSSLPRKDPKFWDCQLRAGERKESVVMNLCSCMPCWVPTMWRTCFSPNEL